MGSRIVLSLVILILSLLAGACGTKVGVNKSSAGAVVSDTSAPTTRLFDRRTLDVNGFNHLADFIRPEIRARLDQEPAGVDEDGVAQAPVSNGGAYEPPDNEPQEAYSEDNPERELELNKARFTWAKKKFGDQIAADPTATGVIILYADENYYDAGRLIHFVEEGRDHISSDSGIDGNRIQVIFGGYRAVAQVELWIIPAGQNMPEAKPEERGKESAPEN